MIHAPTVGETTRYRRPEVGGKCLQCRAPFTKNAPNQKCCSERCRLARNNRQTSAAAKRKRARRAT